MRHGRSGLGAERKLTTAGTTDSPFTTTVKPSRASRRPDGVLAEGRAAHPERASGQLPGEQSPTTPLSPPHHNPFSAPCHLPSIARLPAKGGGGDAGAATDPPGTSGLGGPSSPPPPFNPPSCWHQAPSRRRRLPRR